MAFVERGATPILEFHPVRCFSGFFLVLSAGPQAVESALVPVRPVARAHRQSHRANGAVLSFDRAHGDGFPRVGKRSTQAGPG